MRTLDAVEKTFQEWRMIGLDSKIEPGNSVLSAQFIVKWITSDLPCIQFFDILTSRHLHDSQTVVSVCVFPLRGLASFIYDIYTMTLFAVFLYFCQSFPQHNPMHLFWTAITKDFIDFFFIFYYFFLCIIVFVWYFPWHSIWLYVFFFLGFSIYLRLLSFCQLRCSI